MKKPRVAPGLSRCTAVDRLEAHAEVEEVRTRRLERGGAVDGAERRALLVIEAARLARRRRGALRALGRRLGEGIERREGARVARRVHRRVDRRDRTSRGTDAQVAEQVDPHEC